MTTVRRLSNLEYSNAIWWLMHHSEDPKQGAFPIVCYVDDSGTQESGILAVMGGPVILKEKYGSFNLGWDHTLSIHNVTSPIHMKEFGRPDGRLGYLSDDQRRALFSDLVAVINEHKLYSISASVAEQEFKAFFPSDRFRGLFGPASIAFSSCIAGNCAYWEVNDIETTLAYLVSQSKESGQLEEIHRLMRIWEEDDPKTNYIGPITFDSHKCIYALQAADMIAWSNRRKKLGEPFSCGFQPLERLTRTVKGNNRNYPHLHRNSSSTEVERLAEAINKFFPELPKIGKVSFLLDPKDLKQIKAALQQTARQRRKKNPNKSQKHE